MRLMNVTPVLYTVGLLHFVTFFHVASLLSTGVDNEKVGVDNEKALELDNRIIFPLCKGHSIRAYLNTI